MINMIVISEAINTLIIQYCIDGSKVQCRKILRYHEIIFLLIYYQIDYCFNLLSK